MDNKVNVYEVVEDISILKKGMLLESPVNDSSIRLMTSNKAEKREDGSVAIVGPTIVVNMSKNKSFKYVGRFNADDTLNGVAQKAVESNNEKY